MSNYLVQSILVPNEKGIGPRRAEAEAVKIEGRKPMKTTLEGEFWHNRFYSPTEVARRGYTRYASKKLPSGVILVLAYKGERG
jgi:hypothetical protein